jgi:hypothetical protein
MISSAPFRTYPHQIRTRTAPRKPHPFRTAAPLPYGVRGCGAEGCQCGGQVQTFRTATALDGEAK